MKILLVFLLLSLSGCASINLEQTKLAEVTHADLRSAAQYATDHGYPARAAVWLAIDTQLTACNEAIAANSVSPPTGHGLATAFEVAAETIGQGVPSNIRLNCAPIPLIAFPRLP